MAKMNIFIDSYKLEEKQIIAYTIVADQDVDFHIDRKEFEDWCDLHELRNWNNDSYSHYMEMWSEDNGTIPWEDIYNGTGDFEDNIYDFLKKYIQNLYDMDAMDIETPIAEITGQHKKAI